MSSADKQSEIISVLKIENRSVKSECSRQVGLKNFAKDVATYRECACVDAWIVMYNHGLIDVVSRMIWEFIENSPSEYRGYCQSSAVGVYSKIGEYVNKKGIKSLAHYTINDKYLGSVGKLGDKPISYEGYFLLCQEKWDIDFEALLNLPKLNGAYVFTRLFKPKENKKIVVPDPKKTPSPKRRLMIVEDSDEE